MSADGSSGSTRIIKGRVKWFDPARAFGFIVADDSGEDVLLHANVLRMFGQSTVGEGVEISVSAIATPRGAQAVQVHWIAAPTAPQLTQVAANAGLSVDEIEALPLLPARIKWYSRAKGFGFANVYGRSDDVFVHMDVVRTAGLVDLQPGEAVCLREVAGERGRMAVQLAPWDSAASGAVVEPMAGPGRNRP